MLLNNDYYTPAELTGYARAAAADRPENAFTLERWLPNRTVNDLEYRFLRGTTGLVEAAEYRAYDAEAPIGSRPGISRVSGELPPISRKIRLGEYDRLRQRANPDTAIQDALLNDAERLTRQIAARIEVARADALVNGQVTINENGVIATVSFSRSGSHSVSAGTAWSSVSTATPLDDLLSWRDTYIATNGVAPGALVMSTTVRNYLLRNEDIRELLAANGTTPARASAESLRNLLDMYELPPMYVVDQQVSVGGVATRLIPVDKVLYLPAPGTGEMGATFFGTTAESLEPGYGLTGDEPGLVAGVYRTEDPVALWTKAAAISLPVLANPDLSFVADVA